MNSVVYDITIDAGGDFDTQLIWKDDNESLIDLTGYAGRMHISQSLTSTSSIDCSSYITTNGEAGTIDINMPASITSLITFNQGVYDLEVYNTSGKIYKLLRGIVYVNKEVKD